MAALVAAAGLAGVLAAGPLLAGRSPHPGFARLNVLDNPYAHAHAETGAARRAYERQLLRCRRTAYRRAHLSRCPAPAPATRSRGRGLTPAAVGWGPPITVPSTAIHAVVMPTGKVLWFSQPKSWTEDGVQHYETGGQAFVWDPATQASTRVDPPAVSYPDGSVAPANIWCGAQAVLPDGRVLVVGGNLAYPQGTGPGSGFRGAPWVMTFDPWSETWTRLADMPHGRWYPTVTVLPDGRALVVGGWDETGGTGSGPTMRNDMDVEVFTPTPTGGSMQVVRRLPDGSGGEPDRRGLGLYPHMFVLPGSSALGAGGDKVLVAGPLQWDTGVIDTTTWGWRDLGARGSDRSWGTAVLEPSGPDGPTHVTLYGGSDTSSSAPGDPTSAPPPQASATRLDFDQASPSWYAVPSETLRTARSHFNTVILPDDALLTLGGGYGQRDGSLYADPVYSTELLPAAGGGWQAAGAESDARTYHSTAVLLPDGSVVSAGDDRDAHLAPSSRTAQVYRPAYMASPDRPVVTFAPSAVRFGAAFRVAVSGDPAAVASAVLVRPGAVTHAVDMDQRSVRLRMTVQADGLTLTAPADGSIAPPGYYMLFLRTAAGIPSVASWVRLDPEAPDAPPLPVPAAPPPSVTAPAPAPDPTPPAAEPGPPAPDRTPPRVSLERLTVAARGARRIVAVTVRSGEDARLTVTLAPRRARAGARSVTVRLRAGTRRVVRVVMPRVLLRRGAVLTVRAVDAAGNATRYRRTLTVP